MKDIGAIKNAPTEIKITIEACVKEKIYFFFSLCDKALPATLFDASLYLPSLRILDALEATFLEVTFLAIGYKIFTN